MHALDEVRLGTAEASHSRTRRLNASASLNTPPKSTSIDIARRHTTKLPLSQVSGGQPDGGACIPPIDGPASAVFPVGAW